MDRRAFLAALGVGAVAAPVAAGAQQSKVQRVGVLFGVSSTPLIEAFERGLRELGYVEGKNILIERRFSGERRGLPELAAELVRLKVDVIFAGSMP